MTPVLYDVFISHAYEDKSDFANGLAIALKKKGLKVWYSGFELKLGDSISEHVNDALKGADYGMVIISPVYLQKQWAMAELNALFAREAERRRILPILHNISIHEIQQELPLIADRYAVSSEDGIQHIVNKTMQVLSGTVNFSGEKTGKISGKKKKKKKNRMRFPRLGFIAIGGNMTIHAENVAAGNITIQKKKNK